MATRWPPPDQASPRKIDLERVSEDFQNLKRQIKTFCLKNPKQDITFSSQVLCSSGSMYLKVHWMAAFLEEIFSKGRQQAFLDFKASNKVKLREKLETVNT